MPVVRILGLLLLLALGASALAVTMPTVSYTLKRDSQVSLAIYNAEGGIVRQLLLAAPRKTGANTETWNGLDDKGKPATPGAYTWKLLATQGLKAEWIVSLGTSLKPGYQIMPGNHVGAVTAAVDDAGDIYLMGGCSECVPGLVKTQRDGTRLWASDHLLEANNDCGVGLAHGLMYTLLSNAKVIAIDPATGTGQWKTTLPWNNMADSWGPGSAVIALAARGEQLVVSHKTRGEVCWLDPATGKVIDTASIPAPQGLTIDAAGAVYTISGTSVVKFTRAAKTPHTVVTGLVAPSRLAVDPVGGTLFVAEGGDIQQIARYAPDGTRTATFGRKGGRLYGAYEPRDFRGVTGLAADKDGGFIVIEGAAAPRRVAFFDKHGTLQREWYGGLHYANGGAGDPDDLSTVWYHSGSGEVVKAKIDFARKTYAVKETYKLVDIGDGVVPNMNCVEILMVRHLKGRTYLISQNLEPRVMLVDAKNRRLVPMVSGKYYMMHDFANPRYTPRPFVEAYFGNAKPEQRKYGAVPDAKNKDAVMWTDLNDDGMPQAGEMVFTPRQLMIWSCGRIWADEKLNLYEMNDRPMRWTPQRFTAGGAPVYGGWADWKPLGDKPAGFNPLNITWPAGSGVVPLKNGSLLGFFNSADNPFGKGIGSEGIGGNYVVKWDKAGKVVWTTGFHAPDFGAAPGEARFFWNIAGTAHNCVVITDMQCYFTIKNLVYVWDPDGLWVGRLFDHPDLKAAPEEAYTLATENFGGTLLEVTKKNAVPDLKPGDAVFYGCGQNVTSVYRITGWDTFTRTAGATALTAEQAEAAKLTAFQVAAQKSGSGKRSAMKKFVAATLPRVAAPPTIDGKLDDAAWTKAGMVDDFRLTPAEEEKDPNQTTIRTVFDYDNLYVAIRAAETKLDKLRAFGSPLHLDDSVELFIDAGCTRNHYFQVMVNGNGTCYVGEGWAPRPAVTLTAKAGREAGAWTVELAIPWKNINATAPKPGERVGFNVVRNRFADSEQHSNWSPLRGNLNHTPGYFGTLYADDTLPREVLALMAGRAFVKDLSTRAIALDGTLTDWQGIRPQKIMDGNKPVADVYLGWKADSLYAAFDVTTDRPWKNGAALDMAFNGGAACDVQLGPLVKDRKALVPGDVRFLAAPLGGTTQVVEFLPLLTADLTDADKAPRTYHTDAQGDNAFARLATLPAGTAAGRAKADGKGYIVEMKLPLRAPLKLESGLRCRLDASVILANTAGTRAELRLPLFSISGDDMFVATDVVMETKLRPWNWGEGELE
jgi:DNA-binding beta-propeller fold protein YncE